LRFVEFMAVTQMVANAKSSTCRRAIDNYIDSINGDGFDYKSVTLENVGQEMITKSYDEKKTSSAFVVLEEKRVGDTGYPNRKRKNSSQGPGNGGSNKAARNHDPCWLCLKNGIGMYKAEKHPFKDCYRNPDSPKYRGLEGNGNRDKNQNKNKNQNKGKKKENKNKQVTEAKVALAVKECSDSESATDNSGLIEAEDSLVGAFDHDDQSYYSDE